MQNESFVIIPLNVPFGDFDPCDITTLRKEIFASKIQHALNVTGASTWFGYINMSPPDTEQSLSFICENGAYPLAFDWNCYFAPYAQSLGAEGLLIHWNLGATYYSYTPPDVDFPFEISVHSDDIDDNTGQLYPTVEGKKVNIPGYTLATPLPMEDKVIWVDAAEGSSGDGDNAFHYYVITSLEMDESPFNGNKLTCWHI